MRRLPCGSTTSVDPGSDHSIEAREGRYIIMRMNDRLRSLLVLVAVGGVSGCGSDLAKTYPVKGKVAYKGKGLPISRLAGGLVYFELASDPNVKAMGEIEEDGTFTLGSQINGKEAGGAVAGEYRVRVEPPAV